VDVACTEGTVLGEERLMAGRQWLCTTAASVCIISCIVSLLSIAAIAVNRYVYVCRHNAYDSVFSRRHTVVAVASTWLFGVAVDSPNHVGWSSHWFDAQMTTGQRVSGSRVKWVDKSEWVTWVLVSTRDPLTHDQVNKIPRTGCFVAVMMFDFESTPT